ncbi:MAG: BsuPI-related putative proteinase inhibitor [Verrucomicrobiota bacterium]
MKNHESIPLFAAVVLLTLTTTLVLAVDIRPSRQSVPDQFINPPGKRFSLFQGDPQRVQKANEINLNDFSPSIVIEKESISLNDLAEAIEEEALLPFIFKVKNVNERSYTLSFPDAQRYDYIITPVDSQTEALYVWSADKLFYEATGAIFMNGFEYIAFKIDVPLKKLSDSLKPGKYKITAILSNYPEIKTSGEFSVIP